LKGNETDLNPTGRGKLGCKHHVIVDQRGLSMVARLSGAHVHDCRLLQPLVMALPVVAGLPRRPRDRPTKLHANKGYDHRCYRTWLLQQLSPCASPAVAVSRVNG
jgi:transposase